MKNNNSIPQGLYTEGIVKRFKNADIESLVINSSMKKTELDLNAIWAKVNNLTPGPYINCDELETLKTEISIAIEQIDRLTAENERIQGGGTFKLLRKEQYKNAELLAENDRLREEARWIPVTERVPLEVDADKHDDIIALNEKGYTEVMHYWTIRGYESYTHWRTIPALPDAEKEE